MPFLRHYHQDVLGGPSTSALHGTHEALIEIATAEIIAGSLPMGARSLVKQWAEMHRDELMQDWNLARTLQPLNGIEPLP